VKQAAAVAPPSDELRPILPTHGDFPVYPGLADALTGPQQPLAPLQMLPHVLGVAAGYAYAPDISTFATLMTRMGLEESHCFAVGEVVDAMLIDAHAYLVQSRDGRVVVLAFRGTPPLNAIDWLVDLDTSPHSIMLRSLQQSGDPVTDYQVHAGFYRNTRAIRYAILEALLRALKGESVIPDGTPVDHPVQALYVTGHSLGAAMACLFTVMLHADPAYADVAGVLRATCTFGQPMVGSPALAEKMATSSLCDRDPVSDAPLRFARYLYRKDPVPHLPPPLTGPYSHFGAEYHYDRSWQPGGRITGQSANPLDLVLLPATALTRRTLLRKLPLPWSSADDHNPQNYVTALTPPDKGNEFGDDRFSN
jgi:Lipase (class 3)